MDAINPNVTIDYPAPTADQVMGMIPKAKQPAKKAEK